MLTRLATLGPARLSRPATPGPGPVGGRRPAPIDAAPVDAAPVDPASCRPTAPDVTAPEPASPADLVRPLLQHLADLGCDAQQRRRRTVPVLADRAVADQLAVLAAEVLDPQEPGGALDAAPGRRGAADLADVAARLAALRRALP